MLRASTEREIDAALATAGELRAGAMLVGISFFYTLRRAQIVALAAQHALPTMYGQREFVSAGGLISYATDLAGNYVGRILSGAKPADLPVQQVTKFELIINLKTAKALCGRDRNTEPSRCEERDRSASFGAKTLEGPQPGNTGQLRQAAVESPPPIVRSIHILHFYLDTIEIT
jgi:hypothetical protein